MYNAKKVKISEQHVTRKFEIRKQINYDLYNYMTLQSYNSKLFLITL